MQRLNVNIIKGVVLPALLISSAGAIAQSPTPDWSRDFAFQGGRTTQGGFDISDATTYTSAAMLDLGDGNGPQLYVAGEFQSLGGARTASVARWDGQEWKPLGSGLYVNGISPGRVYGIAAYQGQIYAVGNFHQVGPGNNPPVARQVDYIARFDGTEWQRVGNGIPRSTNQFNNRVTGFDFSAARLLAVTTFDDGTGEKLYFTGNINTVRNGANQNETIGGVGRWDGTQLQGLPGGGAGSNSFIGAFDEDGSGPLSEQLYVAGSSGVRRWTGSNWISLAGGESVNSAHNLAVLDPDGDGPERGYLYATVNFDGGNQWGHPTNGGRQLARWDNFNGWQFVDLGLVPDEERVYALSTTDLGDGPRLYISGYYRQFDFVNQMYPEPTNGWLFSYDGTSVQTSDPSSLTPPFRHSLFPHAVSSQVYPMVTTMFDASEAGIDGLLMLGKFSAAEGQTAKQIGILNSEGFAPFIEGMGISPEYHYSLPFGVRPATEFASIINDGTGDALYVAGPGSFGPVTNAWVAKYDGSSWSAVGTDWPQEVNNVGYFAGRVNVFDTTSGPRLYTFGGVITDLENFPGGFAPSEFITRLEGDTWTPVTTIEGLPRERTFGYTVAAYHNGPDEAPVVYRVNLSTGQLLRIDAGGESELVPGSPNSVTSLAVVDLNGDGNELLCVSAGSIVRVFDGTDFTQIGGTFSAAVRHLVPINDDQGTGLIASGSFASTSSPAVSGLNRVARWNGTDWSPIGSGFTNLGAAAFGTGTTQLTENTRVRVLDLGDGPQLFAGPVMNTAVRAHPHIITFDGTDWIPFNSGEGFKSGRTVSVNENNQQRISLGSDVELLTFNDGAGTALYAVGNFISVDGITSEGIARFGLDEAPPSACLGDIADDFGLTAAEGGGPDGVVDFGDFAALLGLIGPCDGGVPGCLGDIADDFGLTADEGGGPDGVVDFGDFAALLGLIGPCP